MDSKEIDAYIGTARGQLEDAKLALREGRYALSSFLSALSAENASSALIIKLGARPSKKHKNSLVLHRLVPSLPDDLKSVLEEIIESLKSLEPHITISRYPVRKGQDLLPPERFYTKEAAEESFSLAEMVLKRCMEVLKSLS